MSIKQREILGDQPALVQRILNWAGVILLWLMSVGLGVLVFIILNDAIVILGVRLFVTEETGVVEGRGLLATLQNVGAIFGGIVLLAIAVGGAEYHFRRVGQRQSWRVLALTIVAELVIIGLWLIITS